MANMALLVLLLVLATTTAMAEERTIEWQSMNPIFFPSLQKNNEMVVRIDDRLRIECPKTTSEVSIIYRVDRDEAEGCELREALRKRTLVGVCLHPGDVINLTFRSFSPLPNGLEFKPGEKHWFITTSTGENTTEALNNQRGGLCRERHMKLRFSIMQKSFAHSRPRPTSDDDQRLHNDVGSLPRSDEESDQTSVVQFSHLAGMLPTMVTWPSLREQHDDDDGVQLADDSAVRVGDVDDGEAAQSNPNQIQYEIGYRDDTNGCSSPQRLRIETVLLLTLFLLFVLLR